jgi:hypothetical protein
MSIISGILNFNAFSNEISLVSYEIQRNNAMFYFKFYWFDDRTGNVIVIPSI